MYEERTGPESGRGRHELTGPPSNSSPAEKKRCTGHDGQGTTGQNAQVVRRSEDMRETCLGSLEFHNVFVGRPEILHRRQSRVLELPGIPDRLSRELVSRRQYRRRPVSA